MAVIFSKASRVFVDVGDISGYSTALTPTLARALGEVTAFGDSGRKFLGLTAEDRWTLEALYDDTATTGSEAILAALLGAEKVISLWPGGDALSARGWGGSAQIGKNLDVRAAINEVVKVSAEVEFNGRAERVKSLGVKDATAITATANGTSIDDAASSTAGGSWYYHVFTLTAVGGNVRWKLILEESALNVTFVEKDSVLVTATTAGRRAFAGTLERYVRQRRELDATTGTLISHLSYLRS